MTSKRITLEHPDAYEPDAEKFRSQLSSKYAAELKQDGLKRDGDLSIRVRMSVAGSHTVYEVSSDTVADEPEQKKGGK